MTRLMSVAIVVLAAGCGGQPSPAPTSVFVVTVDGVPMSGLNLRIVKADGTSAGGGATDATGRAAVRRAADGPIAPGTYKVTVTDAGGDEPDPMAVQMKPAPSRVPARYARPATTPLTVTIEAGKLEYQLDDVKSKA